MLFIAPLCHQLHAVEPTSSLRLSSSLPYLHRDAARRCDMFVGICLHPWHILVTRFIATSVALGLDSPLSPLRRGWAHRCHTCAANRLTAATCVLGLGSPLPICAWTPLTAVASALGLDSPLPHLRHNCAWLCHICARPGSLRPHLRSDSAHHCHICAGTGFTAAKRAPGPGSAAPTSTPGLGLTAATSALGLCSPSPHLPGSRLTCAGTGLTASACTSRLC
jgi:hypothetical protein